MSRRLGLSPKAGQQMFTMVCFKRELLWVESHDYSEQRKTMADSPYPWCSTYSLTSLADYFHTIGFVHCFLVYKKNLGRRNKKNYRKET